MSNNIAKRSSIRFRRIMWKPDRASRYFSREHTHVHTKALPNPGGGNEKESVEGESAVFVNFHVDGGCVSFACRCRVMMPAIFRQLSLCATLIGGCNGTVCLTVTVVELNSIISLASQPRYYPT